MALKSFREITDDEAKDIVRGIVNSSCSEDQIRQRLTEAGFNGAAAAVTSTSHGNMFMAMVMVYGPHGQIISV